MKITVISPFFPPEKGAAPSRIFNMCKQLEKRGCDIEVITALANYPTGSIFKEYKYKLVVNEVIDGIKAKRYWLFPSNSNNPIVRVISMFSFSISVMFSLFYLRKRKSEVVIVQSPPLLAGMSGVILGRLSGSKIVTNISDLWPLTALEIGSVKRGFIYSFFERIEKYIYDKSDYFLTQSIESKTHIQKFTDKEVFVYRNLNQNSTYEVAPYIEDGLKIVYAGLLGMVQGVLEICKKINFSKLGIELHIYGDGYQRSEIEQYISNNKDSNIILHNSVPKKQIPRILSNYHATLIPLNKKIYGAFPSKIFMASAATLPIFFMGFGEARNLVEEKNIGWACDSNDYDTLYSQLEEMKTNQHEYQKKKENITNLREEEFSFDKNQDNIYSFLNSLKKK